MISIIIKRILCRAKKPLMSKSQETFKKKEKEKIRQQKRLAKEKRKEERRAEGTRSFESMLAYVDENGRLSSTPPDPSKKKVVNTEDIVIGVARRTETDEVLSGTVVFFNVEKGYGFIENLVTKENVFVHTSALAQPVKERDVVIYETEMGPKGLMAVNVKLAV
jgi:cold shock CspA family protein